MTITATNTDDTAAMTGASNVTLIGPGGKRYSPDSGAVIYLGEDALFLETLNPGNSVTGIVVFDVPQNVTPAAVELSGSLLSAPATVALQ